MNLRNHDGPSLIGALVLVAVVADITAIVGVLILTMGGSDGSTAGATGGSSTLGNPIDTVAPAAAPQPGVLVRSRINADGGLRVTQWVTPAADLTGFALRVEPASFASASTQLSQLQVSRDGVVVDEVTGRLDEGARALLSVPGDGGTVRLDYLVEGAVARSLQSAPNRALVDLSVVRIARSGLRQVVQLRGASVLSLACGTAPEPAEPCGRLSESGGRVLLPASSGADVIAAIDLPAR